MYSLPSFNKVNFFSDRLPVNMKKTRKKESINALFVETCFSSKKKFIRIYLNISFCFFTQMSLF